MKDELVAAISQLGVFASEAMADGLPVLAAKTEAITEGLAPMLMRAELMEELWAACKRHAVTNTAILAFIEKHNAWREVDGSDEVTEARDATREVIDRLCDRVADTDGH